MFLLSGGKVNTCEATERLKRRARHFRETDVQLYDFVTLPLAGIFHINFNLEWSSRLQCRIRQFQPAIFKARVAQAESKPIERVTGEIPIGAVRHRVIVEGRQLLDALIEGH